MIAMNFGFLYTFVGRFVFILFVGFMSFSLGLYGQIAMAVLCGVASSSVHHVQVSSLRRIPAQETLLRRTEELIHREAVKKLTAALFDLLKQYLHSR
jgi:hypothetical protein